MKLRASISRIEGENRDLVLVSVDVSHEELGRHKEVMYLLPQKDTVYLTDISNYEHYSVDINDDEEDDFQKYQLSTTYDEENDETVDPIDTDKLSPSDVAQIEIALPLPISEVRIVATNAPVFPSSKVPVSLSPISIPRKMSLIAEVTVVSIRAPV